MRELLTATVYRMLNLLLLPVTLLGYVIWISCLLIRRRSGVSATAQGPLSARWLQHRLGIRDDEPAYRLLMALPGVSSLAVRLAFGPILLAHRLCGYVPQAFRYPFAGNLSLQNQAAARQTFYDSVVDQYSTDVGQFVILGAGFDTRALRLPRDTKVRAFEVDTSKTLTIKQKTLVHAGVSLAGVTYVAADFEQEDWLSRLVEAGFDTDRPTLFLWEGVTPYLDRATVEDTLRTIAGVAQGSVIAFDYFTTEVLDSRALYLRMVRASLRAVGEPLTFGIDSHPPARERLAGLLQVCGLVLKEHRTLGQEAGGKRAWGGYATAGSSPEGAAVRPAWC